MRKSVLVVGVGNILRKDDGIGSKIIHMLSNDQDNIDLLDIGTDGFALLDIIGNYAKTIIVDAVDMDSRPGKVKAFFPHEAKLVIKHDALSTHGFGLAEIIGLTDKLNIQTQVKVVGVQPEDISFGEDLSVSVQNAIPEIIELIRDSIYE